MNELNITEGNEELLVDIYPTLDEIFKGTSEEIKIKLKEQGLWGSMRILILWDEREVVAIGIATVNNLNTGHIEYVLVKGHERKDKLEHTILEKLTAWVKWLKVKSIHTERETIIW